MTNNTVRELITSLESRLSAKGCEVTYTEQKKNNCAYKMGILIKEKGSCTGTVVYVDGYVADIEAGISSIDGTAYKIAEQIEIPEVVERRSEVMEFARLINSKEAVLANARYFLANKKWNEAVMDLYPHKDFLDLVAFYEVRNNDLTASVKITNDIMQKLSITFEELDEAAYNNGDSYVSQDMISMIASMMPISTEEIEKMRKEQSGKPQMYVLTNELKVKGASIMLYTDWFENIAQKEQSDLYVIPSSIHEILVVAVSGIDKDDISQMVQEVNSQQVDEWERLSDHAYFYKRGSMYVTM